MDPVANPATVVISGNARFTVLTERLIRIEFDAVGKFEDRASFAFINRKLPVVRHTRFSAGGWLTIDTGSLRLRYREGSGAFTSDNLEISGEGFAVAWKPGTPDTGNLRGTTRTLDDVNGSCELEPGIISRDGWALVDDSTRLLFGADGWATPRPATGATDWYFFGHGHRYDLALSEFTAVAGRIPLPPRYVLGTWWSRYWAYTDGEFKDLVAEFEKHDVPLEVLVVDMDWHLDGWTGYTWHPDYFPDPEGFLAWAHRKGLRVTLNLHPHDGVGTHESAHGRVAAALGLPADKPIAFDVAGPEYMRAYFEHLHHPLEKQGVDFWWMDWQQGTRTAIEGLDPLFWLNHLHWQDWDRNAARAAERPLIFSRWGGLGNHRYQIGFSGDTHSTWASLAFQPYFTATAGNVGYAWWSHDIGGHQPGQVEPEMYLRWLQWGAFSPILRTHGTKNPLAERRIWEFGEGFLKIARAFFKLRMELVPYIYAAARETYDTGIPLCRPLYLEWPEEEGAYAAKGQYLFGPNLLCAPVARAVSQASGMAATRVWLPPGEWMHYFSRRIQSGPEWVVCLSGKDEFPLFARVGSVIQSCPGLAKTEHLTHARQRLTIYGGKRADARLYEDDGVSREYESRGAWLPVKFARDASQLTVSIGPLDGEWPGMMRSRMIELLILDSDSPREIMHAGAKIPEREDPTSIGWRYDADQRALTVLIGIQDVTQENFKLTATFADASTSAKSARVLTTLGADTRVVERGDEPSWARAIAAAEAMAGPAVSTLLTRLGAASVDARAQMLLERIPEILARGLEDVALADSLRRAWCRLAGVSPSLTCEGVGEGRFRLAARLDQDRDWSFGSVDFHLDPIAELGEPEYAGASAEILGDRTPFGFAQIYRPTAPLPTLEARGAVELTLARRSIRFPLNVPLFPSINGWWICGPFPNPWADGLDTVFPPELGFAPSESYEGMEKIRARWSRATRPLEPGSDLLSEFFVDLNVHFGKRLEDAVAYALCWIDSPRDVQALLAVGSDDGVAVYLNGLRVHSNHVGRSFRSKADRVELPLPAGRSTLLLKISQGQASWGFAAHLEDAKGRPLQGVRITLDPT